MWRVTQDQFRGDWAPRVGMPLRVAFGPQSAHGLEKPCLPADADRRSAPPPTPGSKRLMAGGDWLANPLLPQNQTLLKFPSLNRNAWLQLAAGLHSPPPKGGCPLGLPKKRNTVGLTHHSPCRDQRRSPQRPPRTRATGGPLDTTRIMLSIFRLFERPCTSVWISGS